MATAGIPKLVDSGVGRGIAIGRSGFYTLAMCIDKDLPPSERAELIALVSRQQDQVARLTATIKELRKQLAEAKRAGKRQAAPFSKGGRTSKPRRPGRKPGMGNFSYRKPPSADEVTEPPVDVSVDDDNCPGCGGVLEQAGVDVAYVTDIPAMPRPQVTEYRVQVCRCRGLRQTGTRAPRRRWCGPVRGECAPYG